MAMYKENLSAKSPNLLPPPETPPNNSKKKELNSYQGKYFFVLFCFKPKGYE